MNKKILVVLGTVAVLLIAAFLTVTNGLSEGQNAVLNGIDLSRVSDGSYTGTYNHGRWTNTLTVHVKDHAITAIDIDKDVLAAGMTGCSEKVFRRVKEAQNTQVDAVSGVTVTSKAYLQAIENALKP